MDNVLKIVEKNSQIDLEIHKCKIQISKLKEEKKENNRKIWDECQHTWVFDTSAPFDDLVKYYCGKCSLYRRRDLYFNS